jgi:hypothetical protein
MGMKKLNPKVSEFLKDNADITLIGFAWSGYWRLAILVMGISFAFSILSSLFI